MTSLPTAPEGPGSASAATLVIWGNAIAIQP